MGRGEARRSHIQLGLAGAVGLCLLAASARADSKPGRPQGRGFIVGISIGGGQQRFPGGEDRALALGPVVGQETLGGWGTSSMDVRDAALVSVGTEVPGAERVVPFPASEGIGGLWMYGGYALNRRLAVLLQVGVTGGTASEDYNHAVGSYALRAWPLSRLWLEAGPAFGDLGYGTDGSVVRSGSITGTGYQLAAGASLLRRRGWSLDLEARFSSIRYDGFRIETTTVALGAARLPR